VPFKRILKTLVEEIPGASGAILADWEGEAVEHFCHYDDFDLKVIGAHKCIILNQMKELHRGFAAGDMRDAIISTDSQRIIVGVINADYSIVVTLAREALMGAALQTIRAAIVELREEIGP
jgi:predicted regulator of Ras-like GTPase activity (Roadblock/LC7/MglB family)